MIGLMVLVAGCAGDKAISFGGNADLSQAEVKINLCGGQSWCPVLENVFAGQDPTQAVANAVLDGSTEWLRKQIGGNGPIVPASYKVEGWPVQTKLISE